MDSRLVLLDAWGVGSRFAVLLFDPSRGEIRGASMIDRTHSIPLRVAVHPLQVVAFNDDDVLFIKSVKDTVPSLDEVRGLLREGTASIIDNDVVITPRRGARVSLGVSVLPSASINWISLFRALTVAGKFHVLYAFTIYHTHPLLFWMPQ